MNIVEKISAQVKFKSFLSKLGKGELTEEEIKSVLALVSHLQKEKLVSLDDFEDTQILLLLIQKSIVPDPSKNIAISNRECPNSMFTKFKDILTDLELNRVVHDIILQLGGGFHFELTNKDLLYVFIAKKFEPIYKKIKVVDIEFLYKNKIVSKLVDTGVEKIVTILFGILLTWYVFFKKLSL